MNYTRLFYKCLMVTDQQNECISIQHNRSVPLLKKAIEKKSSKKLKKLVDM